MAGFEITDTLIDRLQVRRARALRDHDRTARRARRTAIIDVCKQMISIYNQIDRQFTRENDLHRVVAAVERQHRDGNHAGGAGPSSI